MPIKGSLSRENQGVKRDAMLGVLQSVPSSLLTPSSCFEINSPPVSSKEKGGRFSIDE